MAESTSKIRTLQKRLNSNGESGFPLSEEDVSLIHEASLEVLSTTGFRFACEKVQKNFKDKGFRVEDGRVFFTERDIYTALETIPKGFTIGARNPERDIRMEPGTVSFGMGRGAVTIVDPDGAYRAATEEDVIASIKLGQRLDELEHVYPLAYPYSMNRNNVYLWAGQLAIKLSDKPCNYANRHDIDLNALAYRTTREELVERSDLTWSPGHSTAIVHSPLTMVQDSCENLMEYARTGISFHVASMPIACTSGPASLAGTIVLQNCENLAPIVFSQLIRPGLPVFYGALGGHADMMSLSPRFGTPEAQIIEGAGNRMARYYGLLCRGNTGLTDSPSLDFQAGAQAMLGALGMINDGPSFIIGAGLLGSYMGGSLAKMVLDVELIIMARRYLTSIRTDREALAVDVIRDVGPGNHFIEHEHTLDNYRSEFLTETLFRSPNYERWAASGSRMVSHLAHDRALKLLESYERPYIDEGLEEEIDAYVERNWVRK